jgi:hypothetical protein
MGTTGFFAISGAVHDLFGLDHQIIKLDGFNQVGIPHKTSIFDANIF